MGPDELYKRLAEDPVHPTTTQPMPSDFAKTYGALSEDADAIVSIHLPAKVSGTCNAALQGIEIAKPKCEVHVVDGLSVSVGLGIIATAAARVAKAGGKLVEVLEETEKAISQTQIRGLLDTLHYLLKGGRITKAKVRANRWCHPTSDTLCCRLIEGAGLGVHGGPGTLLVAARSG